jgi:hypothetical protein
MSADQLDYYQTEMANLRRQVDSLAARNARLCGVIGNLAALQSDHFQHRFGNAEIERGCQEVTVEDDGYHVAVFVGMGS